MTEYWILKIFVGAYWILVTIYMFFNYGAFPGFMLALASMNIIMVLWFNDKHLSYNKGAFRR